MRDKLPDRLGARQQQGGWKKLHFVENDNALRDVVELAASARLAGVERLEELDGRRHDDGRVPVLGCETGLRRFLCRVEVGVVLQYVLFSKDVAEDIRRLFDDRCIRNHVDDALQAVLQRVAEREGGSRKGLSPACRDCQREEPRRIGRRALARGADFRTKPVDGRARGRRLLGVQVQKEDGREGFQRSAWSAKLRTIRIHERFRVQKVSVHQTGIEHANPEGNGGILPTEQKRRRKTFPHPRGFIRGNPFADRRFGKNRLVFGKAVRKGSIGCFPTRPVRQTGMMPGYAIGKSLCKNT